MIAVRASRLAGIALSLLAAISLPAQPAQRTADGRPLPKQCWPEERLVGRDTAFAAIPCSSIEVLPVGVRRQVACVTDRLDRGGWEWRIYETYRSDRRQRYLYSYGRTRPGKKVTNVQTATKGFHHWGLGLDIIHRTKLWNHPRFFYWLGQHYEACGMVAGAFWKRFPDAPHGQFAAIESMSRAPAWAQDYMARRERDSLLLRLGATR
jgi:hypothetical protein